MAKKQDKPVKNLCVYLLKNNRDSLDDYIKPRYQVDSVGIKEKFGIDGKIFYPTTQTATPKWKEDIIELADADVEVGDNASNRAVLICNIDESSLAITFGYGRSLLREEDIERLFNEFDRIDEKRNRSIEGTGLGINIVDKLLKLMGSRLEVSSVYMEGSEFSFLLELEVIEDNISEDKESNTVGISAHSDDAFEAPDIKILVVDDNDLNRKVICSLLKKTKMTIHQAAGGRECIDLVKKNRYDLILLDHMMPEMDGIEALHEMLNNKLIDINETPVIALTANAISGAKEMYLEAGFSGYLSKPVMPNKLNETLFRYIKASKFI